MNLVNAFMGVLLALFSLATMAQTNIANGDCPRLKALIQDRVFVEKVAAENGLSTIRFLSQETPTIRAMVLAYAKKNGVC